MFRRILWTIFDVLFNIFHSFLESRMKNIDFFKNLSFLDKKFLRFLLEEVVKLSLNSYLLLVHFIMNFPLNFPSNNEEK